MPATKSATLEERLDSLEERFAQLEETLQKSVRKSSKNFREALEAVSATQEKMGEFRTEVARAFRDLPASHVPGTGISRG